MLLKMQIVRCYADRFDVDKTEARDVAAERVKETFNESMKQTVRRNAKMVYNSPVYEVTGAEYGLLPAWFLTFRYDDVPYTILVNGQTRKVVGAVPFVKWKAGLTFAGLALLLCALLYPLCGLFFSFLMITLLSFSYSGGWQLVLTALIGGGALFVWTWSKAIKNGFSYYMHAGAEFFQFGGIYGVALGIGLALLITMILIKRSNDIGDSKGTMYDFGYTEEKTLWRRFHW